MIELQAGGAYYFWRLPPPRRLGGGVRRSPKKLVRCSREELYEGHYAHPAGATKSNSSRARREGRQVVRSGQMLEFVVSTPRDRVTCGSPLARGPAVTLELVSTGT